VEHVGSTPLDGASELAHRDEVGPQGQLALERRQVDHLHTEIVGQILHRRLPG
jgi:hypothetical protein